MEHKELYRQAYAALREQNEAELRERAQHPYRTHPETNWQQFVELVEFCWRIAPAQSDYQRYEKLNAWARYFERVEKLAVWRHERG
jgi:hypothetical protein